MVAPLLARRRFADEPRQVALQFGQRLVVDIGHLPRLEMADRDIVRADFRSWSTSWGNLQPEQLRELDGVVRARVVVVDAEDDQVAGRYAAATWEMYGASSGTVGTTGPTR